MSLIKFVILFGMVKCIKSMIFGSLMMLFALGVCCLRQDRHAPVNLLFLMLVPLMVFTGGSKLFFMGKFFLFSNFLYGLPISLGAFYFGVSGILALIYTVRMTILRRRINRLSSWQEEAGQPLLLRTLIEKENVSRVERSYLRRIRVYLTDAQVSPFSGGLLHPYIVLPRQVKEEWKEEEIKGILSHELCHIRSGHIWMRAIYQLLKFYWWMNPLIYLADRELKRNQEYLCDIKSILSGDMDIHDYGVVLLRIARLQNGGEEELKLNENVATFSGRRYLDLRKRILRLKDNKFLKKLSDRKIPQKRLQTMEKCYPFFGAAVFLLIIFLIIGTSYPRYTVTKEVMLFDSDYHMLVYDMRSLDPKLRVNGDKITFDPEIMRETLEEYQVDSEYVLLSYNVIMKTPGAGGSGQAALIYTDRPEEVFYLANMDCWQSRLQKFVIKYLI